METPDGAQAEPANLRFLRRLVTVLTVVMICGLLLVTALLVIRFSQTAPALPDHIVLPDGARAETFTLGRGWYGVVTEDQRFLVFDAATGALRQEVVLDIR